MLGPLTQELIASVCPVALQPAVTALLSESCSHQLPGVGTSPEWMALIDRVQLAAIRGSEWSFERITKSVTLARLDWRDLLVAKGFANDLGAHRHWQANALMTREIA